jgi:hypothetical protein
MPGDVITHNNSHNVAVPPTATFPTPLAAYPPLSGHGLLTTFADRIAIDPFNAVATTIFLLAVIHTFVVVRFAAAAERVEARHRADAARHGRPHTPNIAAAALHLLGEVEVVFGLWAVVLMAAIVVHGGWHTATAYINDTVNYTEPMFVVVIMALASTRPIVLLAEATLRRVAAARGATAGSWWFTILTVGPLLGSLITEPAAMTICALLLARQFYDLEPSWRLKCATLGLLFVNVSIGGTLTHFAAPPILMVARTWGWDTPFMLAHFGWRAAAAIVISNTIYFVIFRAEFATLAERTSPVDIDAPEIDTRSDATGRLLPVPAWVTLVHVMFLAWTVINAHYPAMFIGGFLFFLGFVRATTPYQAFVELKPPLLVGFFLAGLVIHGGLQAWWIAPVLASLSEKPLFAGATVLTAFNDNALVTFLSTLVPNLADRLKMAVVAGAVTGGGLTVIANAPNPAGQAILARFFNGAVPPLGLFLGAMIPTLVAALLFAGL